jgi:hypothetical protein
MFKKVFLIIIIILLSTADKVSALENVKLSENLICSEKSDVRVYILEAYLNKYNSPLKGEAINFVEAADKYNLDWKLVAAISGVESTFGKFTPGGASYPSYNGWGWGVYGTQALYFKSWKEGIYTVSEGLRMHYYNKGLTNPYAINRVYAASPTWGAHVSYFLADMEDFEQEYLDNQNQAALADESTNTETKVKIAGISAVPKI